MSSKPSKKVIWPQDFQDQFQAIGELCYQWSILERSLVLLVEFLSGLDYETTACVLSTSRDTSQRCEIASRLVVLKVPHSPWRDCLLNTLSVIQNKMCEKRNRLVHDEWEFNKTQILRINRAVRMPMNSEKIKQLVYETTTPVNTQDIEVIVNDTVLALFGIIIMGSQFHNDRTKLNTLKPPEPLLLLYKRYFPEPSRKTAPKPKPPKKSSRA